MSNKPTNPDPLFFVNLNLEGWGEVVQPCHAKSAEAALEHCRQCNHSYHIISAELIPCPKKWEAHFKNFPKGEINSPLGDSKPS